MKTHFDDMSPMHGLVENQFGKLDPTDRHLLVRLISRCCEKSFRRGFQQGFESCSRGDELAVDLASWRFDSDLDQAFSAHGTYSSSTIDRMEMECHLWEVGLSKRLSEASDSDSRTLTDEAGDDL